MADYDGVFSHLCIIIIGRMSGAALWATRSRQWIVGCAMKNRYLKGLRGLMVQNGVTSYIGSFGSPGSWDSKESERAL